MLAELLSQLQERTDSSDANAGLEAALALSWESLDKDSLHVAMVLSLFAPAPIPQDMIEQVVHSTIDGEVEREWIQERYTQLMQKYFLQQVSDDEFCVIKSVRPFLQEKLAESEQREHIKRVFWKEMSNYSKQLSDAPSIEECIAFAPAIPHIEKAAKNLQAHSTDENSVFLFFCLGRFYVSQGALEQASSLYSKSLEIVRSQLGKSTDSAKKKLILASNLTNLANVYYLQSRYQDAESLYGESLEILRELLNEDHPAFVICNNNVQNLRTQITVQKKSLQPHQERVVSHDNLYGENPGKRLHSEKTISSSSAPQEISISPTNVAVVQGNYLTELVVSKNYPIDNEPDITLHEDSVQSVDALFRFLVNEFRHSTSASDKHCREVANRIVEEVSHICTKSQRIQVSGEVDTWLLNLARHRLKQCLKYYRLGTRRGRVELHSTLNAVVYRYITPPQVQSSYQARLNLIEDFLQNFYVEALNAFRREKKMEATYCPRSLLELSEYMAFTERYGKRRIPLPRRRSQQLIILRAQTFSKQQSPETLVDMERTVEGVNNETEQALSNALIQQVREQMVSLCPAPTEDSLRDVVSDQLLIYLKERQQQDCADYFILRLKDLPDHEIEAKLGLTPHARNHLQQRFKYHLIQFALSHHWELVHQWLEADLEHNFGLTSYQWNIFWNKLTPTQQEMLELKKNALPDKAIAQKSGCTITQMNKQWSKLLEKAWEIRNNSPSGLKIEENKE